MQETRVSRRGLPGDFCRKIDRRLVGNAGVSTICPKWRVPDRDRVLKEEARSHAGHLRPAQMGRLCHRDGRHRGRHGPRRAVPRGAERLHRRARLPAGRPARRHRLGQLARDAGVRGRRAVLQLLLPAACSHTDDRRSAELGRARRVSRHRRDGRAALGARQKARDGGGSPPTGNQAREHAQPEPARGEPRCARHDRHRRQDQRRQCRHRDADRPFAGGPHRHRLLRLLHRGRGGSRALSRGASRGIRARSATGASPCGRARDLRALQRCDPSRRRRQRDRRCGSRPFDFHVGRTTRTLAVGPGRRVGPESLRGLHQPSVDRRRAARPGRLDVRRRGAEERDPGAGGHQAERRSRAGVVRRFAVAAAERGP